MKKRIILIVVLSLIIILWIFGIYKLSSMNNKNSNGKSSNIITVFIEDALDITNKYGITNSHPNEVKLEKASALLNTPLRKVMHAFVYFVLSFLIILMANIIFKNKRFVLSFIITVLLIIALASLDEYHQIFVVGRTGQLKDVLIDSIGGICGIIFYGTYYFIYKLGYKRGIKNEKEHNS